MIPRLLKLVFPVLVVCVAVSAQERSKNEMAEILSRCEKYFGPAVDAKLNLFEANSFYVLEVNFDSKNGLEQLRVVPKHDFEDDHPEWKESDAFEYLSWVQYQNLLARVDLIKPRGNLTKPPPPFMSVTNSTAWQTSIYENARLTVGFDPGLGPALVKSFDLRFGKKAKQEPKDLEISFDAFILSQTAEDSP